jgi:hypothetical protein
MEWTLFAGFRANKLCGVFLLSLVGMPFLFGQRVVYSLPKDHSLSDQQFFCSTTDTVLVVLNTNRWGRVESADFVMMRSLTELHWKATNEANWAGVRLQGDILEVYYSIWDEKKEMTSAYQLRWQKGQWSAPVLLFEIPHSAEDRTPRFKVKFFERGIVFLSDRLTYANRDVISVQLREEEETWKVEKMAKWKIGDEWREWGIERWELDNHGNVLLLTGENRKNQYNDQRTGPRRWQLYYYDFSQQHLKQWDLLIGDKQIKEGFWQPIQDSTWVLGITCSDQGSEEIKGWLRYEFDARSKEVTDQSYWTFEYSNGEAMEWIGREIIKGKFGTYLLVGENYYATEMRTTDFQTGRMYSHWTEHFDNVYCQVLDDQFRLKGDLLWIHKQQEGGEASGCSFEARSQSDEWIVRFNDHPENEPSQSADRVWTGRKTILREVRINQDLKLISGQKLALPSEATWFPVRNNQSEFEIWWKSNAILICTE